MSLPCVVNPRNLDKDNIIPELYNVEFNEDFQTVSKKIKCTTDSNYDSVKELGGLSISDCMLYSKGNTYKWIYGVKVKDIICSFDDKGLYEVSIGFSPSRKNFERLLEAYSTIFDSSTKYTGKEENFAFWQTTSPSRQVYLSYDEEKNDLFIRYKDMR